MPVPVHESVTKMTDRGVRAVADVAARHPALEVLIVQSEACPLRLTDVWNAEMREGVTVAVQCCGCRCGCHSGNRKVTDAGWAAVSAGVRRNPNLALQVLYGVDMAKYDNTLPDHVVKSNDGSNLAVLSYYGAQARIRRRVAAVAVLCTAWRRSHGRPVCDSNSAEAHATRVMKLAHMVQLRRMCRVREGKNEVAEPFGRCVVAYL